MARQLDATAFAALTKLLDKVIDKHETHQDGAAVQQIKALCKQSDENINWISSALLHSLKEEHAQTRLHVVNLIDQLFQRSRAFRAQLTANFTDFLELSLGFRPEKPLPGPASVASQLRDRALEVVEQWNDKYGSTYKQVSLGYSYLKNNMAMRFPEVRARAAGAQAEAQERQVRSQALLQDRYQHMCAGFAGHVADISATLTQIAEGFTLIEGTKEGPAASAPTQQLIENTTMPEDEIAWEAVEPAAPAAAASTLAAPAASSGEEGLSAYAMDTIPEDLLQQAESGPGLASQGSNRVWVSLNTQNPAVVENLQGLAKVVANRQLPRVQGWLKVLVKLEVGEVGTEQHAQRERMLRSAIELQTQLRQSQQKLEALTQQLADTPFEAQGTCTSATRHTSALMDSLFGSDDDVVGTESSESQTVHVQKTPGGKQQADSAAGVAQQRRQTTAGAAQAAGTARVADHRAGTHANQGSLPNALLSQANPSNIADHTATAASSQQLVDPSAPRRSISFSNSLRRRQASSIKQRKDAFNAAADAAVIQAAAQRSIAGSQAADSGSGPPPGAAAAQPEADESRPGVLGRSPHKPMHGITAGADIYQAPVKQDGGASTASMPDEATGIVPSALPRQPSVTQDLPGGRVQSAAAPASPAKAAGPMAQGGEEAPRVITRTSQAESAPKLKTDSRLAASMAKLAASKRAPSNQPALVATATPVHQSGDKQKNSAIPDDVKRALLAKAPVVAHGNDLVYWDSNNARALVNARGMEYQNHWGAHDPDVELPSEQLNAFFGTRAEYWTPSGKPQTVQGHPQQPPGHHQQPASGQGKQSAGSVSASSRDDCTKRQSAVPSGTNTGSSAMGNVRAQRAADRAHNEAVIASTDEQVAQDLADEEAQAAVKVSSGSDRGTKRKPQPSVRERLAKKLLSGKARHQTLGEVESVADERFQEVNSNRWQATRFP